MASFFRYYEHMQCRCDSLTAFSAKSAKRIRAVHPHKYTASNFALWVYQQFIRRVESATGKSPKKWRPANKARYILHAYRKCGGTRQDERAGMREEEKAGERHTWKASRANVHPRENGRPREREINKEAEGGCEGFLRLPARHSTLPLLGTLRRV